MATLIEVRKRFRVGSPAEGKEMISEAYDTANGDIDTKLTHRNKISKGEVVDEWWIVEITEKF